MATSRSWRRPRFFKGHKRRSARSRRDSKQGSNNTFGAFVPRPTGVRVVFCHLVLYIRLQKNESNMMPKGTPKTLHITMTARVPLSPHALVERSPIFGGAAITLELCRSETDGGPAAVLVQAVRGGQGLGVHNCRLPAIYLVP